jgi:hypothetical protein
LRVPALLHRATPPPQIRPRLTQRRSPSRPPCLGARALHPTHPHPAPLCRARAGGGSCPLCGPGKVR